VLDAYVNSEFDDGLIGSVGLLGGYEGSNFSDYLEIDRSRAISLAARSRESTRGSTWV
jgi:hypothetical protein